MTEIETETTEPQITLADLVDIVNLIDLCSQRGAFRGEELQAVGSLRHTIVSFIETHNPPDDVIGDAPEELNNPQDETNETIN